MKKMFLIALLSSGIIFTGSFLYAGPLKGDWNPKSPKMKVLIDVDSGDIMVFEVKGGKETIVKPGSIKELLLNGKHIISIPDYTVIRTHSSPGCITIFYNGYPYQICN